jgi:hypothetical protein
MSKTVNYRAIVQSYETLYGPLSITKPVVFNITGSYRNKLFARRTAGYYAAGAVFLFIASLWLANIAHSITAGLFYAGVLYCGLLVAGLHYLQVINWFFDPEKVFDGEIIVVNGKYIGVAMPSQETEGKLESKNFVDTNDRCKLLAKLNDANIVFNGNEVVTWSVGSTTAQNIDGLDVAPCGEVGFGIDANDDSAIIAFLAAHAKELSHDGVLVLMNSAGYGVRANAGIVYNDNKTEYDTITPNIQARSIGGTGNNENAMSFVEKLVKFHKQADHSYILAVVPRGDKTMPQGGSHSKQRVMEHYINSRHAIVIEVSGKQTKKFELQYSGTTEDDPETICKNIKDTKVVDAEGKCHGSDRVFNHNHIS